MTSPKKKKPPTSTVVLIASALRKVWGWSAQRKAVVTRAKGCCEECGIAFKTSKHGEGARCEIHHLQPVNMTKLAKQIDKVLFPGEEYLTALCTSCHKEAERQIKLREER